MSKSSFSPPSDAMILQYLLASLRGAHWSHWTSHWQVKGSTYYGDHLLLERLYTGITAEIDTLAEKIVAYYGPDFVNPIHQSEIMNGFLEKHSDKDPIRRALSVELSLLQALQDVYSVLETSKTLPLGLNDFLAATANAHETFVYLLKQRTR